MPGILSPIPIGVAYSETLTHGGGGIAPFTWAITAGSLPAGLSVISSGILNGTPTEIGTFLFTLTVTDSAMNSWSTDWELIVYGPLLIDDSIPVDATVGSLYSQSIGASGGISPYSFTVTSGAMPAGFSLDASTGALSGIPVSAGVSSFTVTVTDSISSTASGALTVTVAVPGVIISPIGASGVTAPVVLVEIETASGNMYFISEHQCTWPSILTGAATLFRNWLTGRPKFTQYGSTQTDTANLTIQNISGNTIERDIASIWSESEFTGALVVARIWRGDSETALLTFIGLVSNAEIDENQLDLTVEGFGNYSAIVAPSFNIDVTCPLTFGSVACGSTSTTPCDQSYGGCLSLNRFAGVVTQWDQECPNMQFAQPPPAVFYNPARPF